MEACEETVNGYFQGQVVFELQPMLDGGTNVGTLAIGTTKGDVNGMTKGEGGAVIQARECGWPRVVVVSEQHGSKPFLVWKVGDVAAPAVDLFVVQKEGGVDGSLEDIVKGKG